ncbi:MAG: MATE family efflux transporter [Lachnospiraceae bacterium]|nr:MATE family efflux transporter [Lachnospiraceae bacterium]
MKTRKLAGRARTEMEHLMKTEKENIMGTMPVPRLVIQTGIPLMLSLLINSLYNFVDSVFVSRLSEDALTAVSLSSPVQTMMGALGCGIAVGLNAVISKALGENDREKVKKAASASFFLAGCAWLLILACFFLFGRAYFTWQSGGNTHIEEYGYAYLSICMIFSFGQMGQWVFDRFVIASSRSHLFLFTLSASSVTNLILDPIFIFGYFGLPAMGTAGAAAATAIGQIVGCIAGYCINRRFNPEIPMTFTLRPDGECIREILYVGIPTTLVQSVTSLVGIFMNTVLIAYSTTAVAVYGVCLKIQNLATVGVHGIDNGLIPIVAYNYGAKKEQRIYDAIKWALLYSFAIYLVILAFLECFPMQVLRIFDASEEMLAIGIPALRILAVAYLFSTFGLVFAAVFQALGMGTFSLYLTSARQVLFPLIFVSATSLSGNIRLIWSAFIFSEILALPVIAFLAKKVFRKVPAAIFAADE